ncbi:MAG: hypothetical protein WD077_02680 [Bacteroidia bacterium]
MKKFKEIVTLIRDIIMIVGIPIILSYAYIIHQEQIKTKDSTIELVKTENEILKENQIDRAITKLKSQREFYENEITDLEMRVKAKTGLVDSLKMADRHLFVDSPNIILSETVARKVLVDLHRCDIDRELLELYIKIDSVYKIQDNLYKKMLLSQSHQLATFARINRNQDKVIQILEKLKNN